MIFGPIPRFWIKNPENPETYRLVSGGLKLNHLQTAPVRLQNFPKNRPKTRLEPKNCEFVIFGPIPRFWIKNPENPETYRLVSGGLKLNHLQTAPVRLQNFPQNRPKTRLEPKNYDGGRL